MISYPAGLLKHRVILQKPVGEEDAEYDELGERVTDWIDVNKDLPANVRPLDAREAFIAAQISATTTHKVTIRYSSEYADIDATWRVLFRNRPLIFQGNPKNIEEENVYYEIDCTEGKRVE